MEKQTIFSNIVLLCDDSEKAFGVRFDPGKEYQKDYYLGDIVNVTSDSHGYISPGITSQGRGVIIDVHEDKTDHFFTVKMDNGEIGFAVKANRLEVICR